MYAKEIKFGYIAQYQLQDRTKMRKAHCAALSNYFVIYCVFRFLWVMKNIGSKSHLLAVMSVNIQEVSSVILNRKVNHLEVGFLLFYSAPLGKYRDVTVL